MTTADGPRHPRYQPPAPDGRPERSLTPVPETPGVRYPFYGRIEIGRDDGTRAEQPGLLLVPDPTVSKVHCVVQQREDGRCVVLDVSRNGTRLDGRRLVPNVEAVWLPGQILAVGSGHAFVLLDTGDAGPVLTASNSTIPAPSRSIVTVLVGDIADYTGLVRRGPPEAVQAAVSALFQRIDSEVVARGGTVKEYQGDAVVAFWEAAGSANQAVPACRAALELDALVGRLAADPTAWPLDVPLRVDWALATGLVLIGRYGKNAPAGLSMMGEAIVKAFRLEKFADRATGRIVACAATHDLARGAFRFRDLGERIAKGFDAPDRIFALEGDTGGKGATA
jgi:adenylate cyclase